MKNIRPGILFLFLTIALAACTNSAKKKSSQDEQLVTNPIIDGNFADPCIVKEGDTYFSYATIDP